MLVATLAPLRRILTMIPGGSLRTKWLAMNALVYLFMLGYLGFMLLFWGQQRQWLELSMPVILLFGSLFVGLTVHLSLQTALDLRRIDLLETENITDALTGVYNRRYLDHRLALEVARAKSYALSLSVLMIDIDNFKRINDSYGHPVGDVVLATLASLIKSSLRDQDVAARYGGEEFFVICTNTNATCAAGVAERLRRLVEAHPVEFTDGAGVRQSIQSFISVGVSGLEAGMDSQAALLRAADQALYRAKKEGKNRVVLASAEPSVPV